MGYVNYIFGLILPRPITTAVGARDDRAREGFILPAGIPVLNRRLNLAWHITSNYFLMPGGAEMLVFHKYFSAYLLLGSFKNRKCMYNTYF